MGQFYFGDQAGKWVRITSALTSPIEHPHYIVHRLQESGLCVQFPEAALRLLDAVLVDQTWAPRELRACLDVIVQAMPSLHSDRRYQRLVEYARRRGL